MSLTEGSVSPLNWVVLAVWAIVLAALFPTYVRTWRHREALARLERTWRLMWPYSEAALQGWLRAQMATYIAGWFMLLAPAGILIRDAPPSMRVLIACVALIGVVGILTMVVIVHRSFCSTGRSFLSSQRSAIRQD